MKVSRFFPVLALIVAIAGSAFTSKKATGDVWYLFNSTNYSQVDDVTKYVNTESDVSPGCSTSGDICAIKLPDSGNTNPDSGDFSGLQSAIQNSEDNHSASDSRIQMQESQREGPGPSLYFPLSSAITKNSNSLSPSIRRRPYSSNEAFIAFWLPVPFFSSTGVSAGKPVSSITGGKSCCKSR